MKRSQRKTAPKVRDGKVQKKNRHAPTPSYWNTRQRIPVIDKEKPGRGFKHYLRKDHLTRFIQMLPDWDELSKGLDAVILAQGGGPEGWFDDGVIGVCAWQRDPRNIVDIDYHRDHADIFNRLGVQSEKRGNHYICTFSEEQVRAYQLLHIFLHELGHHHDRNTDHGEWYAEKYARQYESGIWLQYLREFEL
jgi:hypothetical protein